MGEPINALLFDLDGVLVLSEALVYRASCPLINESLRQQGVMRDYTAHELRELFTGLGLTQIMRALGVQHGFQISSEELQQLDAQDLKLITQLLEAEVESSPGAHEMLAEVCNWGLIRAVVSSSEPVRIEACLRRTGLGRYLPSENLFSASDPLAKLESKPSSAVYDAAVQALGIARNQCVAVEDSVSGIIAAKRANIEVVGFVGAESADKQAQRSKTLFEAGASAVFSDWPSFLAYVRPRVRGA